MPNLNALPIERMKLSQSININHRIFLIFILIPFSVFSQIAIHGDIFLGEEIPLGIHSSETNFVTGGILTDDNRPGITYFATETDWEGATHNAHVEGYVWVTDHSDFHFPLGHERINQPMAVHNSPDNSIAGRFVHKTPPIAPLESGVARISQEYFWEVIGDTFVQLSFGWTALSNLNALTSNLEHLVLLGFNGDRWDVIPTQINTNIFGDLNDSTLENGAITSVSEVNLGRYNRFTLGAEIHLQVSEAFTPNGDGINDTWYIRDINFYPNANIKVFNRWGSLIYEAKGGYQNDWDGHFAEKRNPLPSAPYFYQIDLESDGKTDIEGWLYINY